MTIKEDSTSVSVSLSTNDIEEYLGLVFDIISFEPLTEGCINNKNIGGYPHEKVSIGFITRTL
jgi:hypothetical protein